MIAIGFEYIVGYIVVDIMMIFSTTISGQITTITTMSGQINEKCGFLETDDLHFRQHLDFQA